MPYTYLIGWSKHNKFYYGARWAKNCSPDDLWKTYFTSSRYVKQFHNDYGEPDIIQVRKLFDDASACRLYEYRTLCRLNVLNDDKWLNRNINGRFLPLGKQDAEHIKKRSASMLATRRKNGTLGKVAYTAETRPDVCAKISMKLQGKKKTPEHVVNMRTRPQDTMRLICPHCSKEGDYKNMKRWHMDNCRHQSQRPV